MADKFQYHQFDKPCFRSYSQAAFDELTVDNADQKAQFVSQQLRRRKQKEDFATQMAKAGQEAANQKVTFDSHMAQAALDATGQQTTFDSQMAKATLEAAGMQVR